MPKVNITNMGKGPRVIYTEGGGTVTIERGQTREGVDLSDGDLAAIQSPIVAVPVDGPVQVGRTGETGGGGEPQSREGAIREAIGALGKDEFTQAGKPEVNAINALLGDDYDHVTAAERDAIWEAMQAKE